MAQTFRGRHNAKMDAKGRISIPAPFRRVLDLADPDRANGPNPTVHICWGEEVEPFLTCWTQAEMEDIDERIMMMPDGSPERQAMEEYFMECVDVLTLDDNGRLVLPKRLRDLKALDGETTFAGRGSHFRMYSAEAPTGAVSAIQAARQSLAPGASILSLLPPKQQKPDT